MNISSDTISIRLATPDDASALRRLAALDSAEVPSGPVLLAEREGRLHAALALNGSRRTAALADPFVRSAALVELLRRSVRYVAADPNRSSPWHRLRPHPRFAGRTASG